MGLFGTDPHEITDKAIQPDESLGEYFERIAAPDDEPRDRAA